MNKRDYIILDIGKIFIKYNPISFYKEVNNNLVELTKEESEYINNIFTPKESNIFYSEQLNLLINHNFNFSKYPEYTSTLLGYMERIIPEGSRDNFYRNLLTLNLNLNIESIINSVDKKEKFNEEVGSYNAKENSIIISPAYIKNLSELSIGRNDANTYFFTELNRTLLHEFSHMASTYYNKKNDDGMSGFGYINSNSTNKAYRGLTEGMADYISYQGNLEMDEVVSNYYLEALIVGQLLEITDKDVMYKSFFENKGIDEIKKSLNTIINNQNKSNELFDKIELNFCIRNRELPQTILTSLENNILDYYEKKIDTLLEENKEETAIESINRFEQLLITNEKVEKTKRNPENYIELDSVSYKFENIKGKINKDKKSKGVI